MKLFNNNDTNNNTSNNIHKDNKYRHPISQYHWDDDYKSSVQIMIDIKQFNNEYDTDEPTSFLESSTSSLFEERSFSFIVQSENKQPYILRKLKLFENIKPNGKH